MQQTFSDMEYEKRYRKTRKEEFLEQMEEIITWGEWVAVIEPFYYPDRKRGRKPLGIEKMLRMYLLQCWLHHPKCEKLYILNHNTKLNIQ